MEVRGWQTAEVARRLGEDYDRATFYRLLNGATTDPRLGTLISLCRALELSPTELLQLAGAWPYRDRAPDVLDSRLRGAFAQLRSLPIDEKRRAIRLVLAIAEAWDDNGEPVQLPD